MALTVREKYLKFRADPKKVAKKKKYLNKWYKKNRKKQLAYKKRQLRLRGDVIRMARRLWKAAVVAQNRANGLSRKGNPLLTKAEQYMLGVWFGLESANKVPQKKRVAYAKKGAKALWEKRDKRVADAAKKFGMEISRIKRKI